MTTMLKKPKPTALTGYGARLTQAREASGLSQEQLAAKLGTYQPQIAGWEAELRPPTARYLVAIARELHVSADWLLGLSTRGGPGDVVQHKRPR